MNSDDVKSPGSSGFKRLGSGHASGRMCSACNKPKFQLGGTVRKQGPMRFWRCAECSVKVKTA